MSVDAISIRLPFCAVFFLGATMIGVKEFKTKNGKNAMRGKCSVCDANVVNFVKK